jgi:hypothetical protein
MPTAVDSGKTAEYFFGPAQMRIQRINTRCKSLAELMTAFYPRKESICNG